MERDDQQEHMGVMFLQYFVHDKLCFYSQTKIGSTHGLFFLARMVLPGKISFRYPFQ